MNIFVCCDPRLLNSSKLYIQPCYFQSHQVHFSACAYNSIMWVLATAEKFCLFRYSKQTLFQQQHLWVFQQQQTNVSVVLATAGKRCFSNSICGCLATADKCFYLIHLYSRHKTRADFAGVDLLPRINLRASQLSVLANEAKKDVQP